MRLHSTGKSSFNSS